MTNRFVCRARDTERTIQETTTLIASSPLVIHSSSFGV
jgi:hypothetical protein